MSHCSGLRLLVSATLSILDLIGTSIRHPVVVLCHGDATGLILQDWPLHMLQQFLDGVDGGVVQLKALDLGHGGS